MPVRPPVLHPFPVASSGSALNLSLVAEVSGLGEQVPSPRVCPTSSSVAWGRMAGAMASSVAWSKMASSDIDVV